MVEATTRRLVVALTIVILFTTFITMVALNTYNYQVHRELVSTQLPRTPIGQSSISGPYPGELGETATQARPESTEPMGYAREATERSKQNSVLEKVGFVPSDRDTLYRLLSILPKNGEIWGHYTVAIPDVLVEQAVQIRQVSTTTTPKTVPLPLSVSVTPQAYSVTNVQVEGIDEPDIVKTNGTRIFVAQSARGTIAVVNPLPSDNMSLIAVINVTEYIYEHLTPTKVIIEESGKETTIRIIWPWIVVRGLHILDDGRLVVIAEEAMPSILVSGRPLPLKTHTWIIVYGDDLTPETHLRLSGRLSDTRLYNNTLVIVTVLPVYNNKTIPMTNYTELEPGKMAVVSLPPTYYTIVTMLRLSDYKWRSYALLGPHPVTIYLSPELNLYLVLRTHYLILADMVKTLEAIRILSSTTLTPPPTITVTPIPPVPLPRLRGVLIVKLSLDTSKLSIRDAGRIALEGVIRKQWQLDEYNGTLRIAIEEPSINSGTGRPAVKVVVKIYNSTTLKQLSSLKITLDQNIYGIRFLGDRLYIVTFRRVDPLFAIDLSNPRNPVVLGYLEGPGFDEYLHPINKTALIGIGRENNYIRVTTYKVGEDGSINVVSRVKVVRGWTQLFTPKGHRAFVLDKYHGLIMFPVQGFEFTKKGSPPVEAIAVIRIDFHSLKLSVEKLLYHESVMRVVYIDDTIYTISAKMVKSYSMANYELLDVLELAREEED